MIVYQLFPNNGGGSVSWHGTLTQAQAAGKDRPDLMLTSLIRQHDIDTSKDGILLLLNSARNFKNAQRTWKFTKRGGITEVAQAVWDEPDRYGKRALKGLQAPEQTGASPPLTDEPVLDPKAPALAHQDQATKEMDEWRARHPFRGHDAAKAKERE